MKFKKIPTKRTVKKPLYTQRLENVDVEMTINHEGRLTYLVIEPTGMEISVSPEGEFAVEKWPRLEGVKQ